MIHRFFLTTSTDRTTRAHAPWSDDNEDHWHEISRPQIHGYEMSCLAIFNPFLLVSGAEEKVIRVFKAPLIFQEHFEKNLVTGNIRDQITFTPSLNLSNKACAVDKLSKSNKSNNCQSNFHFEKPPTEEVLVRCTLWPELKKLYGHSYEIFSMAAQNNGSLLATSSKSSTQEHSGIILWDTNTWRQKQKLLFHELTVTQLAFSPDDNYLLSVSRDRRWSLYVFRNEKYILSLSSPKKDNFHRRVIWCCTWTNDSQFFATGSRDGRIGIWKNNYSTNEKILPVLELLTNDNAVTALSFTTLNTTNEFYYLLAVGYENGTIDIKRIKKTDKGLSYNLSELKFSDTSNAHHLSVKRISFRPRKKSDSSMIQLASCGADSLVKIYKLSLN